MIRSTLFLVALMAVGACAANVSTIPLPTCQYSSINEGSLFDIDLKYMSDSKDGTIGYSFELQVNPYDPDDCKTPSCCDTGAIFKYVSIDLMKECGPPSLNFIKSVVFNKSPLAPTEYSLSSANDGGTKITAKLPPSAPGSKALFDILISNVSMCGLWKNAKKAPCPQDGCPATIITKNPSNRMSCCKTERFTSNDHEYPKKAKLPADTGMDVSSYPVNLLVLGDWGAPPTETDGYKRVEFVGKSMAVVARKYGAQAVLNTGDNFYESGLILNRSSPSTSLDKTVWEKLFMVHPELNVPWHGVLGNHDYSYGVDEDEYCPGCTPCIAKTKEQYETQQCVSSALLQHEGVGIIKNPNWKVRNGTWTVKDLGGRPGLVDLIMFDGNAFVRYGQPDVYGGLQEQDGKKVTADLSTQMRDSNATWRFVMSHFPLLTYGRRCVGGLNDPSLPWKGFDIRINSKGQERSTDCGKMKHIRKMVFDEGIPLYINGHDHMAELLKNASTYMLVSGNGYKQSTVYSMNNADTRYLVYGHALPEKDESGQVTDWYPSDAGFNSVHVKDDALVIKFWGIGSEQAPNVPAHQLSLHFEIKLNRKDFPYPNKKSPAPRPAPQPRAAPPSPAPQPGGVPPSPVPQPAASPPAVPSASPPAVPSASPPPTPGAQPPSPAIPSPVLPSPPLQSPPAPVLSSPPPPPGSPAAVPPSG